MKKEKKCTKCFQSIISEFYCDSCGKDLLLIYWGIPITISFGFGHNLDREEYHFCNNKCAIKFLMEEEAKENPRDNLVYGQDKKKEKNK